ncbi:MAG TPA: glutathione peroxidase [Methylomirabilota bacterium]
MHARRRLIPRVFTVGVILLALAVVSEAQQIGPSPGKKEMPLAQESLYRLTTTTLEGQPADLKAYAGKVALVVNVASQCGYTPQYAGLEKLYAELKGKGFVVLGFPSNDFGGQEPGTAAEIRQFCTLNYDVSFPLFDKVVTKAGAGQSPVYANLQKQSGELPSWNFAKYLVSKDGKVLKFYKSGVTPDDPALRKDIEAALR